MKFIVSIVALCLCATLAPATNCVQRVIHQAAVVQQDYAAISYIPLLVTVPAYSAGYAPVPTESLFGRNQPQAADPTLQQLLTEVQKIRAEVEQIKAGTVPLIPTPPPVGPVPPKVEPLPPLPPAKETAAPAHMNLFVSKCASCHDKGVAEKKGASFVLLDGTNLAPLTPVQRLKIATQLYSGRMPKNGKATDLEVHEVMQWLDRLDAKAEVK